MSIEHVHAYRFQFLKSEEWRNVRLEAVARDKGKCQLCNWKGTSQDAHHVFYPASIWDTNKDDLVTLCRACHDLVHELLPKSPKTYEEGMENFLNLKKIINNWRLQGKKQARSEASMF